MRTTLASTIPMANVCMYTYTLCVQDNGWHFTLCARLEALKLPMQMLLQLARPATRRQTAAGNWKCADRTHTAGPRSVYGRFCNTCRPLRCSSLYVWPGPLHGVCSGRGPCTEQATQSIFSRAHLALSASFARLYPSNCVRTPKSRTQVGRPD